MTEQEWKMVLGAVAAGGLGFFSRPLLGLLRRLTSLLWALAALGLVTVAGLYAVIHWVKP